MKINSNEVYKIGEHLYVNGDKNSGLHEYHLICDALKLSTKIKNTLFIINGALSNIDKDNLSKLFLEYKRRVFISSDAISFTTNLDIINECDILLHQCPFNSIPNVKASIKQYYSYVPELFYQPFDKRSFQDNLLFYGGGLRNSTTLEYLNMNNSKALLKTTSSDDRLTYEEYLLEATKHKFALIIGRDEYNELSWVTSRFIEAAACWNYPIVDIEYDRHQYFGITKAVNALDANNIIKKYSNDEAARQAKIIYYRNRFSLDKFKFIKLLEEILHE